MEDWFPELRGADNAHSVDFFVVEPRGQCNMAASGGALDAEEDLGSVDLAMGQEYLTESDF